MNTKLLSLFAATSILAMLTGIALHAVAPALFALAAIASILLIAVTDYAPRRSYDRVTCGRRREHLPFAA